MDLLAQVLEERKAEGVAQGQVEQAQHLLRRLLLQRFGSIPADLEERIAHAPLDLLNQLFERALTATAIDTL